MTLSNKKNFCPDGGYLVNAFTVVPDDPVEYSFDHHHGIIGCNQLVCDKCGAGVRHIPHAGGGYLLPGRKQSELYDAEDWRTILIETPGYSGRFYFCRCSSHTECRVQVIHDSDLTLARGADLSEIFSAPPQSWHCNGHPLK